jgi:hypothetical protein
VPLVKVLSKDYIWHVSFMCWSMHFLNCSFFIFNLTLCVRYKYILLQFDHILYILCIHALYRLRQNNICSRHIFKIHDFQGKKHVWTKNVKMCCKHEFHQFQLMICFTNQHYDPPIILKPIVHIWFLKSTFEKKIVYIEILSALNMQKDSWSFINLPQFFIIKMLLVMEFIPKEKMRIQIIVFVWIFFKDIMI